MCMWLYPGLLPINGNINNNNNNKWKLQIHFCRDESPVNIADGDKVIFSSTCGCVITTRP